MAPGTGRNGTERFGDWLVGEAGETQGCRYFFKNSVCGKVVSMRIGMGYDVHRLVEGRDLIIGGVKIPYEKGLLGHSDADVLLHAIMDALLGAAALGDIGKHFPDTDPAYKGISSIKLLEKVGELLEENHVFIENIDATIICERDSHKGIIIGKQGAMLKKIGTNARYEIEHLLDAKVNLKLWVKVKKDWRDSDYMIKNFGYREEEF